MTGGEAQVHSRVIHEHHHSIVELFSNLLRSRELGACGVDGDVHLCSYGLNSGGLKVNLEIVDISEALWVISDFLRWLLRFKLNLFLVTE